MTTSTTPRRLAHGRARLRVALRGAVALTLAAVVSGLGEAVAAPTAVDGTWATAELSAPHDGPALLAGGTLGFRQPSASVDVVI